MIKCLKCGSNLILLRTELFPVSDNGIVNLSNSDISTWSLICINHDCGRSYTFKFDEQGKIIMISESK